MMTTTHDDQDDDHRQKMCQPEQKTRTKPEIGNETRQETPAAHSTAVSRCYNAKKKKSLAMSAWILKRILASFLSPIYKYIQIYTNFGILAWDSHGMYDVEKNHASPTGAQKVACFLAFSPHIANVYLTASQGKGNTNLSNRRAMEEPKHHETQSVLCWPWVIPVVQNS